MALPFVALVALAACATPAPIPSVAQADAFARNLLNGIQAESIRLNVEFCGFLYLDAAGRIAATPPVRGTLSGCIVELREPTTFASYHTHGAYEDQYDSEVPSVEDMLGDFRLGVDGYISTPGGRVWRVDYDARTAFQICGLGCVRSDPGFVPRDEAGVRQSYTLPELRRR